MPGSAPKQVASWAFHCPLRLGQRHNRAITDLSQKKAGAILSDGRDQYIIALVSLMKLWLYERKNQALLELHHIPMSRAPWW